jgi:hypothetical protein
LTLRNIWAKSNFGKENLMQEIGVAFLRP